MRRAKVALTFTYSLDGKQYAAGSVFEGDDDAVASLRAQGFLYDVEDVKEAQKHPAPKKGK